MKWTLIFAAAICAPAVAADRTFAPVASESQTVEYRNGEALVIARTASAAVIVSLTPKDKKAAYLNLGVQNNGGDAFLVSDESVSAQSGDQPLKVSTYADRMKAEKRRQMWASVGAGLQAASNSMAASQAGYQSTSGSYQGTTNVTAYGTGSYAQATGRTQGTYYGTGYSGAAAHQARQAANASNNELFGQMRAEAEASEAGLNSRALQANTVSSGEFVSGDVEIQLPKRSKALPAELVVSVAVDGDVVSFRFVEKP